MTFSDEITTLALELAKSLWAELGVGGSQYRHDWQAIDLEPLIIFTASLAGTDDVFVARTIRWCALNSSWISTARLRNLSPRFCSATRDSLDAFISAIDETARSKKSDKGADHAVQVASGEWPDLKRPALIQLRLRARLNRLALTQIIDPKFATHDALTRAFEQTDRRMEHRRRRFADH